MVGKKGKEKKEVIMLKFGIDNKKIEKIDMEEFEPVMENREVLVCVGGFYQSEWVEKEANGQANLKETVILKVPHQH